MNRIINLYRASLTGLRQEVWYLAIVLLINRSGAMVIPFLTVYLTTSRDFTLQQAGLVMSSFGVGSLVGSYVGGYLTDRIGFHKIQQLTLLGSGGLFWLLGQVNSLTAMCLVIFLLSTVAEAFRPANQSAIAYYSKAENRSRAYGLLRLAVNLGFSVGPLLGGLLISSLGYSWLFFVDGLTCILAALAYRLLLPPGKIRPAEEPTDSELVLSENQSPYRDPAYLVFVGCILLFAVAFMQFFSTLPIYLTGDLGYSEWHIGILIGVNGLLIVFTEMPLVHLAGARFRPLGIIAIGIGLTALSFLVLTAAGTGWAFVPFLFIIFLTFGEILSMPFSSTFAALRAPQRRRGAYMGLLNIGYAVAFILAPTLGMWCAEQFGFAALWLVVAGLASVSTFGILMLYFGGVGLTSGQTRPKIKPVRWRVNRSPAART